jgi:RNA polymerase sigma-70 factor (ECF subfamily)
MVAPAHAADEEPQLKRLREGDTTEIELLVRTHHPLMIRVASAYVGSRAVAEDVAQDTWIAVFEGLADFESRSSLRTWMFHILTNIARRRGQRESRVVPFSMLVTAEAGDDAAVVDPERFMPDNTDWPGHWLWPPRQPAADVDERLLDAEAQTQVAATVDGLPLAQRTVLWLRSVEGWTAEDVCLALDISAANQRVLLHRARSAVRSSIEKRVETA